MTVWVDEFAHSRPVSYHPEGWRDATGYGSGFLVTQVDIDMLTRCVTRCVWSPIVWKDGRRIGSHFECAAWMTLDFDDGTYTLEQAIRDWSDSVHVIGTTKSHRVPKPKSGTCDRFRIIAPWQDPIDDPYTYQFNISKLIANYGADKACKDLARFFYPCREVASVQIAGYLQPTLPPPKRSSAEPPKRYREHGIVRRRTVEALKRPFPEGQRNNLCFTAAKDLCDAGFSASEIYSMIVNSPTYQGKVDEKLEREIRRCIQSGIKSVTSGVAYGRRDRP